MRFLLTHSTLVSSRHSLKRRIKGLAIYAEEAVSPKHALDRPISPSDFFRET